MLAIGGTDHKVTLLSVPGMEEIIDLIHVSEVRSLSFSPIGGMLAGGGGPGKIVKQSKDSHQKVIVWKTSADPNQCYQLGSVSIDETVNIVAFSPSSKWLACGSEGGLLSILNAEKEF